MGIFDKFKIGLSKSSKSLSSGLNDLIFKKKINENTLNELEDFLIQSDVGVESAKELKEKFSNTKVNPKESGKDEIFKIFSNYVSEILKPLEKDIKNIDSNKPSVILIAGVNGVGKTTTIGKLGKILGQNNKKVAFGAADSKVFALLGIWLGFKGMFLCMLFSIYIAGLFSLVGLIFGYIKKNDKIPFAPFISTSSYLIVILGNNFWERLLLNPFTL